MPEVNKMLKMLSEGAFDERLKEVYVTDAAVADEKQREKKIIESFASLYGDGDIALFSAPGRTELGGNHTDHNHGRVLAASVNLDAVAAAAATGDMTATEMTEGHALIKIDISDLEVHPEEYGKSEGLIRGVCAGFKRAGYKIGGFNAASASKVMAGSGLSSSAAYEVLIGTILNHLFNDGRVGAVEIAKIAQFAENEYFGKPCGLMDQTASAVGNFISRDFKIPSEPVINKVDFDFASCGHALCIIDTGGSHAGLTEDYAAIRGEMESAAAVFGKSVLRDVEQSEFMANIPLVRKKCGDRAVLRAIHFYNENRRAEAQAVALSQGDFEEFKNLVIESGRSSFMLNQNVYSCKNPQLQGVAVALALCEEELRGRGAWRVHGGGFAGTVQAFVPNDLLAAFSGRLEGVFGIGACHVLSIRSFGGIKLY